MKPKKLFLALLACCLPGLLWGCTMAANPLERARATDVPGLSMELHAASASQDNVDTLRASLYYRFGEEPMLAAEPRVLQVRRDESLRLFQQFFRTGSYWQDSLLARYTLAQTPEDSP